MKKMLVALFAIVFAGVANAQVVEEAEGVTKNEPITILDILMGKDNGTVTMVGNVVDDEKEGDGIYVFRQYGSGITVKIAEEDMRALAVMPEDNVEISGNVVREPDGPIFIDVKYITKK